MASASIFNPTLGSDRTQPETSEIGRLFHSGGAALPLCTTQRLAYKKKRPDHSGRFSFSSSESLGV